MNAVKLLDHLISFDTTSPPGNERPAAMFLYDVLKACGFHCEVQELGNNRANLIAVMGEGSGPELMFNGHLDVVPAYGQWRFAPFIMTRENGRLYGRGTADMKGGIAAMCEAAILTAKNGGPKRGRLKLLFVADEECSNLGTLKYLEAYGGSDYVVIGEPTGLEIAIAHRGVFRTYIDLHGPSRHAALPASGRDSIEKTGIAIEAVKKLNRKLQAVSHEVLPPPGIAITKLEGYEKDNVVPGTVRMLLDFRILPGMSRKEAEEVIKSGLEKAGLTGLDLQSHFYMPGGELPSDSSFVRQCMEERKRLFQSESRPHAFGASCEQCFFVNHGMQAIICGPGELAKAHTINEFLLEEEVRTAVILYQRMIDRIIN